MMSDLIVDAHDVVRSESHPTSIILNPHTIAAIISMHDHAPMLVPLIHARPIIPN
jgi:hypothetical protein